MTGRRVRIQWQIYTTGDRTCANLFAGVHDGRVNSPLVSVDTWYSKLALNNFSGVDAFMPDHQEEVNQRASVMLSTALSHSRNEGTVQSSQIILPSYIPETYMEEFDLFTDRIAAALGGDVTLTKLSGEDASFDGKTCIVLTELYQDILATCDELIYYRIRNLLLSADKVVWVTRSATIECRRPGSSLIIGLARTIRAESPGARLVALDLDNDLPDSVDLIARILIAVRTACADTKIPFRYEAEYVLRDGKLYVPRLVENEYLSHSFTGSIQGGNRERQLFFQDSRPLRLALGTPGDLESIHFADDEDSQGSVADDELRIRPYAMGVMFRHILIALGRMPSTYDGCGEVAGTVTDVGSALVDRFQVGDRVTALGCHAYSSIARVKGACAQVIPDEMSFPIAASIPASYLTAYYSLVYLARLRQGEKVLIHSAAGGLGIAALHICRNVGAEVFATVGSEEKKAFLVERFGILPERIFSSRQRAFASGIKRLTNNAGVHVVLNSLAKDALHDTLQCCARFGRFIELGVRDIAENTRLSMGIFEKSVSFMSFQLLDLATYKPDVLSKTFKEIRILLRENREMWSPEPQVFGLHDIQRVFRTMQSGNNIGKITLEMDSTTEIFVRESELANLPEN